MDLSKLAEPMDYKTRPGPGGTTLSYITARQVQDRLDEVCGPENWSNEFKEIGGHLVCRIGIKCGNEWVWKEDVGTESNIEAEKGSFSDAMKRAAVMWGVGRFLYGEGAPKQPAAGKPVTDAMKSYYGAMLAKALDSEEHRDAATEMDSRMEDLGHTYDAYDKAIRWLKTKGYGK